MTAPAPQSQQIDEIPRHTPTPWKEYAGYIYAPGENGANICAMSEPRARKEVGYTEPELGTKAQAEISANADLIVEAVNNHEALKARIQELETALRFYACQGHWMLDGQCDPNSSRFEGPNVARAALSKGAA